MHKKASRYLLFILLLPSPILAGDYPLGGFHHQEQQHYGNHHEQGHGQEQGHQNFNDWEELPEHRRRAYFNFINIKAFIDDVQRDRQMHNLSMEQMSIRNTAQEIENRRANEGLFSYLSRPQTIVTLGVALLTSPFAYKFIQELLADEPNPQVKRINEINMEMAELTLAKNRLHFERENQQAQVEGAVQMFKLEQMDLHAQKEKTEHKKEAAKLKIIDILSSLTEKQVHGEKLTEQETEKYKLYHKMLGMLTQAKPGESDEPDTQEEDLEVDVQQKALAAAAA